MYSWDYYSTAKHTCNCAVVLRVSRLKYQNVSSGRMYAKSDKNVEKQAKQDHQALLKAKYCPRVAAV